MTTNLTQWHTHKPSQSVIEWLLDSDPAIRWQVMHDLTDAPLDEIAAERAKVAREGWGAKLLLTHTLRKADDPLVTFVTDGIERALQQPQTAANGKAVYIGGGADVAQQYLQAGLVDELHISLVPLIFGEGIRLFDNLGEGDIKLHRLDVVEGEGVTHIKYRIGK